MGSFSFKVYNAFSAELTNTIQCSSPISAMTFQQAMNREDDGRYLWLGLTEGMLMIIDAVKAEVVNAT